MTPTTTLDASRQQAHPPSPSSAETLFPCEDEHNRLSTSGVGASNEPIWIPSDIESDVEDDGDDGQDFDGSRSDATLPSINSLATQSSPHTAVNPPTPTQTSQTPDLEHFPPDQAPCQGDDALASGTLACHDGIPETPHEYPQRHLSQDTSEGQGLATADATGRSTVTGDAMHIVTPNPSSRSTPDPPTPACASQPPTLTPLDTDDAPCRGDDMSVSATPSRQNSIPGAGDVSPQRQPSFETPQGQDHETSDRGSEDVEAHVLSEGAPQSSSGARASLSRPLGPITRRRARRQAVHRLAQDDDDISSDTSNESQGSESHLDRANLRRDKDYYPSHTEAEEMGLEGDQSNGEDQCPRKRRKVSRSSAGSLRNAAASVERPRRGRPSLRSWGKNSQASGILSPASSQATSDETQVTAVLASFEEWPLENASLKRITENGKTTFQLQFDWTPCTKHGHASSAVRNRVDLPSTRTRSGAKRASAPRAKYSSQEDDLLIELKEGREMLAWPEIHQRFCEAHPGRSVESLQVHYSTKLKSRERL
ncbi:hypothetical protein EDB81DRAFT_671260 [Dactylonectria macrodidyma]|uniref:Myb-like domain-containing protein n=1 Tax=Dactylonectria macrodidyma TaxID=307937 RepID=A0A9P9I9K6_9HYPO|nr:hypothetical protein EDB81DRAFT_671260 [Dactylonectria macrodidyma]